MKEFHQINLERGGCVLITRDLSEIIHQMIHYPAFNNKFQYKFEECEHEHPWGGQLWKNLDKAISTDFPGGSYLFLLKSYF